MYELNEKHFYLFLFFIGSNKEIKYYICYIAVEWGCSRKLGKRVNINLLNIINVS